MSDYQRACFEPLGSTQYGIGFHWTTWTLPETGEPLSFPEAVDRFDVGAFVEQAVECGAGHVLLTVTHELHWLPGPNVEVDRILPGRTCRRDLIMEIADGLAKAGIRLVLYYNHGTARAGKYIQDPEWQAAVGAQAKDRSRYFENYCRVVSWMGEHYGSKVIAFWFDSAAAFWPDPATPWERFSAAAKAGHSNRLITYNSGVLNFALVTPFQDFWAGEIAGLPMCLPTGQFAPNGLPWYSLCTWNCYDRYCNQGEWGISQKSRNHAWTAPDPDTVAQFVNRFHHGGWGGAVTFNLLCYQNGRAIKTDLDTMKAVRQRIRKGGA